jgi:hypothetical protein
MFMTLRRLEFSPLADEIFRQGLRRKSIEVVQQAVRVQPSLHRVDLLPAHMYDFVIQELADEK